MLMLQKIIIKYSNIALTKNLIFSSFKKILLLSDFEKTTIKNLLFNQFLLDLLDD